jgi:hypothetical protein
VILLGCGTSFAFLVFFLLISRYRFLIRCLRSIFSTEVYINVQICQIISIPFFSSFRNFIRWYILIPVSQNIIPFFFQFTFDSCRLLGLSAFAGFIVLIAGWPLNSILARRNIRIQKGLLAARDKRMGVLDELIRAVCIIFHSILQFYIHYLNVIVDRSNSLSFLHGKNDGSTELWILGKLK